MSPRDTNASNFSIFRKSVMIYSLFRKMSELCDFCLPTYNGYFFNSINEGSHLSVEFQQNITFGWVRVHAVILIFHLTWKMKKLKMDTYFPFSIYDEKWKMKNWRHLISFSICHRKWKIENGYPFSIFDFPFAMENTKWATEKATKMTTHILGPLAQLLLKTLLTVTWRIESIGVMGRVVSRSTFNFQDTWVM